MIANCLSKKRNSLTAISKCMDTVNEVDFEVNAIGCEKIRFAVFFLQEALSSAVLILLYNAKKHSCETAFYVFRCERKAAGDILHYIMERKNRYRRYEKQIRKRQGIEKQRAKKSGIWINHIFLSKNDL